MRKSEELQNLILNLEEKRRLQEYELQDEFKNTLHSLEPLQLIKNGLSQISGKKLSENILGASVAAATGLLGKNLIVRKGSCFIRKFIGNALERFIEFKVIKKIQNNPR